MTSPPKFSSLSSAEKDALIATLLARLTALEAENAALREKLRLRPKTPDNSSVPPSRGQKASEETTPKRKPHRGAFRALHPNCPCCAKSFKAPAPEGLEPGSPFGPNLRAFLIYLRFAHAISFERLARLAGDLLGLEISEGALVNILDEARPAFTRAFDALPAHLPPPWCAPTRPACGWPRRSGGPGPSSTPIEAGDAAFAPGLRKLLQDACAIGRRRPGLADTTLRTYAYDLDRRLDALLRIAPLHTAGAKLQQAIKGCRGHLFVFLRNRAVPATNNGSEQALQPCVVFRKVTNCFRSRWAAELCAHVRSVIETARRRGMASSKPSASPSTIRHPRYGVSNYKSFSLFTLLSLRDVEGMRSALPDALEYATKQSLIFMYLVARLLEGWILLQDDDFAASVKSTREALAAYRMTGASTRMPIDAILAEALAKTGETDEALDLLAQVREGTRRDGELHYEAERCRVEGDVLLDNRNDPDGAQQAYQQAITVAQSQGAKLFELRAATSLAKLWHRNGRRDEAWNLLHPLYGWFTEGFGEVDLRDARATLSALETRAVPP